MRRLAFAFTTVLLASGVAHAQNFSTAPCTGNSGDSDSSWFGHNERACEMRRTPLPLTNGHLAVGGNNGSIEVIGEDRPDIALAVLP